jgi:hypothetical protein
MITVDRDRETERIACKWNELLSQGTRLLIKPERQGVAMESVRERESGTEAAKYQPRLQSVQLKSCTQMKSRSWLKNEEVER